MALNKIRLGDYIERYTEKCNISNLTVWDVSGVNKEKEFFEPSKQVGKDTSDYKVVPPNYFACNLMHVGRDCVLPIAINRTDRNKYVSPAYTVFNLINENKILREYLFIFVNSSEKDRYFWFHCDSSVRDGMEWSSFCDIELEVPDIEIQKKYVAIYEGLLANLRTYENGLDDLKVVCDIHLDKVKHDCPAKTIGEILVECDKRNVDGKIENVHGINIDKVFMPSVADTSNVNLLKYKVVEPGQIAFSGMQTGRDECIRIALNEENTPIIISPAYSVFRVSDEILPGYLLMWFRRKETDRLGWFVSDSSIRSNLDMDRFNDFKIPVPEKDIQRKLYECMMSINARKQYIQKLKEQITTICPVLIKGSIEEARRS